jgi:hypothetical protein
MPTRRLQRIEWHYWRSGPALLGAGMTVWNLILSMIQIGQGIRDEHGHAVRPWWLFLLWAVGLLMSVAVWWSLAAENRRRDREAQLDIMRQDATRLLLQGIDERLATGIGPQELAEMTRQLQTALAERSDAYAKASAKDEHVRQLDAAVGSMVRTTLGMIEQLGVAAENDIRASKMLGGLLDQLWPEHGSPLPDLEQARQLIRDYVGAHQHLRVKYLGKNEAGYPVFEFPPEREPTA